MGLIQSVFCAITFCIERVLTWTCCAFLLMLLMFSIIVLMVYGISVGYHYAQKELAIYAMSSKTTTKAPQISAGDGGDGGGGDGRRAESAGRPVVRLVAVNRSAVDHAPLPMLEVYKNQKPTETLFMDYSEQPIVLLETERPPSAPEMLPHEKELARKLIGRFRRSKNTTTTNVPFLRPYKEVMGYRPAIAG